ncbi:hypothetical protein, partial [Paenibacillus rhizolycopersici]|uniref:hypothetical protein n=1 Tax=Paenibacillus rhizolycopersici TaxID=2780073 RepID=UPI003D280DDE
FGSALFALPRKNCNSAVIFEKVARHGRKPAKVQVIFFDSVYMRRLGLKSLHFCRYFDKSAVSFSNNCIFAGISEEVTYPYVSCNTLQILDRSAPTGRFSHTLNHEYFPPHTPTLKRTTHPPWQIIKIWYNVDKVKESQSQLQTEIVYFDGT